MNEPIQIGPQFDYDLQVWFDEDGTIQPCSHPLKMSKLSKPCCAASLHAYGGLQIENARHLKATGQYLK